MGFYDLFCRFPRISFVCTERPLQNCIKPAIMSYRRRPVSSIIKHFLRVKGERCALGLAGAGRPICEAMMNMDIGLFEASTGEEIDLSILKTVAAGDECCDVMFALKGQYQGGDLCR